ncbi:helix-turn-helix domain-containing protein [Glaciimonas soli]|uniref:Helix-turn-helix domain-containing protein n=1 Tax=Glaciimonas soli TaxID=2590999 RepID=A0A843YZ34_9BURK|nr:helix-turn-helix domain-containing protein [Glaciimonas soli]MQR02472.1 helix-turn-helix domain-containing protein [Glaciimonas soli]
MRTLDVDECAEFLKVERSTVLKLAGEGKLPGAKIGRAWVFLEDDLVEYVRTQVRAQMRERQAKAEISDMLERSAAVTPPMITVTPLRRRGRRASPTIDFSRYENLPELGG